MNTNQQIALFEADFEHKHYTGDVKQFEVLEQIEGKGKGFFIRIFFINDKVNLNKWQVTWDGIKQDISDVIGLPIVLQDDLAHPDFLIQNLYAKGYIIDYIIDDKKHEVSVIARILDPETIILIKKGKLKFSSPAIVARNNLALETLPSGVDLLSRFIALHLALVGNPAYGKGDAKIIGQCTGTGQTCGGKLKQLNAQILRDMHKFEDHLSDKILVAQSENPNMSQDQVLKIAISMCEHKANSLTQTPCLKKLQASINRLESEFNQLQRQATKPEFNNQWGYWIKAQDIDVFVADNSNVDSAISNQC